MRGFVLIMTNRCTKALSPGLKVGSLGAFCRCHGGLEGIDLGGWCVIHPHVYIYICTIIYIHTLFVLIYAIITDMCAYIYIHICTYMYVCNWLEVGIPFCSKSCAYFSDNVVNSSASHILLCSSLIYIYIRTYIIYIYIYKHLHIRCVWGDWGAMAATILPIGRWGASKSVPTSW